MANQELVPVKLLLVEGQDDKHVVEHLRGKLAPDLSFCCRDTSGVDRLLNAISVEMKPEDRLALGILMDANTDVDARWQAIGDRLRDEDVQLPRLPNQPEIGGTIIEGNPRVGVWLMPNNQAPGELEDFVVELVPKDDPVWPLAEKFINCIPQEHRRFAQRKELRAKLHAWLAAQQEPQRMGTAIRTGALNAQALISRQLAEWLTALFGRR